MLPGLEFFFVAFLELGTCRSIGFGEGPIPWTAVQKYCEVYGIRGEQREDLFYHIQTLDAVYLEFKAKKVEHG